MSTVSQTKSKLFFLLTEHLGPSAADMLTRLPVESVAARQVSAASGSSDSKSPDQQRGEVRGRESLD